MGIIVDLLPGVVVRTEPKHVKLLARCLGLHTWFKKQINKQKTTTRKQLSPHHQQTEGGLASRTAQGMGSRSEIINYNRR